jgi:hypothetical protein
MLRFDLLRDRGILVLRPEGSLRREDFTALAAAVDPFLEESGELRGVLVDAPSFPGWADFAALVSHVRFVRDHHQRVRRIALVTDSPVLSVAPAIARHFLSAEVRRFEPGSRADALAWIDSGVQPASQKPSAPQTR